MTGCGEWWGEEGGSKGKNYSHEIHGSWKRPWQLPTSYPNNLQLLLKQLSTIRLTVTFILSTSHAQFVCPVGCISASTWKQLCKSKEIEMSEQKINSELTEIITTKHITQINLNYNLYTKNAILLTLLKSETKHFSYQNIFADIPMSLFH